MAGRGLDHYRSYEAKNPEFRNIRSGQQLDTNLGFVPLLVIILSDPFSNLSGGGADNRIGIGVVVRLPAEHLHSEAPLFQFTWIAFQGVLNHVAQQVRIALTVLEKRIRKHAFQLLANGKRVPRG